jgi:hypothetical protein
MNILKKENNKIIKLESYFENEKNSKNKDDLDNNFPYPIEGTFWTDKEQFLDKLVKTEKFILFNKNFYNFENQEKCVLCYKKKKKNINVSTGYYSLNDIIWKNSLIHYISDHNIKPSNEFIDFIYQYNNNNNNNINKNNKKNKNNNFDVLEIDGESYMQDNIKYLKVHKNQILIMDALMIHGGYNKKYFNMHQPEFFRFSEHAGILDFDDLGLDKIIISAKTSRVDKSDNEIYFPKNMKEALDYEYIFHTHPPTPKPGSRAKNGILYEFPSISDILHFIDHYNLGETQGSIVIAPEGLYNIRKFSQNNKNNINLDDEDIMIQKLSKVFNKAQYNSIQKYGSKFTLDKFYKEIVQDFTAIDSANNILHEYDIHIDYFPRIKDSLGNWFIDTIYLPVLVNEKI